MSNMPPMTSPLRGLEKLSEDLRLERQKSNAALQEKARLKIEIESLKQSIDSQIQEITDLKAHVETTEAENHSLRKTIQFNEGLVERERQNGKDQSLNIDSLRIEIAQKQYEIAALQRSLNESGEIIATSDSIVKNYEGKIAAKDSLIDELQTEITQLRGIQATNESKILGLQDLSDERQHQLTEVEVKLKQSEALAENYIKLQATHNDLRREFEEILTVNAELSAKCSVDNSSIDGLSKTVRSFEHELEEFKLECERLRRDNRNLESTRDELLKRVKAEKESCEIAQSRAEASLRGRQFLEQQIEELRMANLDALGKETQLEEEVGRIRGLNAGLQAEVVGLRERSAQLDAALEQASHAQVVVSEVDALRAQLTEMRRQLLKKDVEDDAAATVAPRMVLEREHQNRQVYESIITELRSELDRVNHKCHDLQRKLADSAAQGARIEQLEMEVQMYREAAKQSSVESHSIALSASEALERSSKSTHDKLNLLRTLQNAEHNLTSCQQELHRSQADLAAERQKTKDAHLEKLTAERRASELFAGRSKIEAELDDVRQQRSIEKLELERTKRSLNKATLQISELHKSLSECERALKDAEGRYVQESSRKTELLASHQELLTEVQGLRHGKEKADKEKATLQQKLDNQRKAGEDLGAQIDALQHESATLRSERDMYKRDLIAQETQRAEMHFQEFREDMERTVNEYKDAEKDRKQRDEVVRGLQMDVSRERERASLFKTQINLLEERLRVATKELASYRSLDVYHSSLKSELELYRAVKSTQLHQGAGGTVVIKSPVTPRDSSDSYRDPNIATVASTLGALALSGNRIGSVNNASSLSRSFNHTDSDQNTNNTNHNYTSSNDHTRDNSSGVVTQAGKVAQVASSPLFDPPSSYSASGNGNGRQYGAAGHITPSRSSARYAGYYDNDGGWENEAGVAVTASTAAMNTSASGNTYTGSHSQSRRDQPMTIDDFSLVSDRDGLGQQPSTETRTVGSHNNRDIHNNNNHNSNDSTDYDGYSSSAANGLNQSHAAMKEDLRQRRLERERERESAMRRELSREMSSANSNGNLKKPSQNHNSSGAVLSTSSGAYRSQSLYQSKPNGVSVNVGPSPFKSVTTSASVSRTTSSNGINSSSSSTSGTSVAKSDFERARRLLRMSEDR